MPIFYYAGPKMVLSLLCRLVSSADLRHNNNDHQAYDLHYYITIHLQKVINGSTDQPSA